MDVIEAVETRFTCRAFLRKPVPLEVVRRILSIAGRAPSGGNLQPWRVWAVSGEPLARLSASILACIDEGDITDGEVEYFMYPPQMKEPYLERSFRNGEAHYRALGVARDDAEGRRREFRRNYQLFDAPVGLFFAIDRDMQQGQWADLGMYMQSVMLLAREHGLDTAALESWSLWHRTVRAALDIPPELMFFCGMALGHADLSAPVNSIRAERADLSEFASFDGFDSSGRLAAA